MQLDYAAQVLLGQVGNLGIVTVVTVSRIECTELELEASFVRGGISLSADGVGGFHVMVRGDRRQELGVNRAK